MTMGEYRGRDTSPKGRFTHKGTGTEIDDTILPSHVSAQNEVCLLYGKFASTLDTHRRAGSEGAGGQVHPLQRICNGSARQLNG